VTSFLTQTRVLVTALLAGSGLVAGLMSARKDLLAVKDQGEVLAKFFADSISAIRRDMSRDRDEIYFVTDVVAGLARLRCREQRDRAMDAGIPCDQLSLPFPTRRR